MGAGEQAGELSESNVMMGCRGQGSGSDAVNQYQPARAVASQPVSDSVLQVFPASVAFPCWTSIS